MNELIVLIVITVIVAAVIVVVAQSRKRLKEDLASLTEEERERHRQIVQADKALKEAEYAYQARVSQAERALRLAREPQVLDRVSSATLTETALGLNGRLFPLTPGIRVRLDGTGNLAVYTQSVKATTVTAHALDSRELYLIVTGPDWEESIRVDPNQGEQARRFIASTHTASHHAQEHAAAFARRVADAERAHNVAVGDTAALEAARRARSVLEIDPLEALRAARKLEKRGQKPLPQNPAQGQWPSAPTDRQSEAGQRG